MKKQPPSADPAQLVSRQLEMTRALLNEIDEFYERDIAGLCSASASSTGGGELIVMLQDQRLKARRKPAAIARESWSDN